MRENIIKTSRQYKTTWKFLSRFSCFFSWTIIFSTGNCECVWNFSLFSFAFAWLRVKYVIMINDKQQANKVRSYMKFFVWLETHANFLLLVTQCTQPLVGWEDPECGSWQGEGRNGGNEGEGNGGGGNDRRDKFEPQTKLMPESVCFLDLQLLFYSYSHSL